MYALKGWISALEFREDGSTDESAHKNEIRLAS